MERVVSIAIVLLAVSAADATYYCPIPEENFKTTLSSKEYKRGFPIGSKVKFYCTEGYELFGSEASQCTADGWNPSTPICFLQVTCTGRGGIQDGSVSPPKGPYFAGDEITYSCETGFKLIGAKTDICQNSGEWKEEKKPFCRAVTCKRLRAPPKGFADSEYSAYFPGEEIKFSCQKGYRITGNRKNKCGRDGKWIYESTPKCIEDEVSCPTPRTPVNGGIEPEKSKYFAGDEITFFCGSDSYLNGTFFDECLENGKWRYDERLACIRTTCLGADLSEYSDWRPKRRKYFVGDKVEVECEDGYSTSDDNQVVCRSNGKWSKLPRCKKVVCHIPKPPAGGYVLPVIGYKLPGQRVRYFCDEGYKLIGRDHNVCTKAGFWKYDNDETPTCVEQDRCRFRTAPEKGDVSPRQRSYRVGQKIKLSCEDKYYLDGPAENVCEEGGEWKYRWTPKCRKYCVFERDEVDDENIVHSAIQRRFEYKAEIHFKCKRSTLLVGDDYIKCGEDGVWEKKIPKCVPVCYRPTVQNGKLLDDKSLKDVFVEGDTAEISCDDGFRPKRAGKVTCLSGGEWDMEEFCISNKQRCSEKEVRNGGARPKEPWYEPGASVRYFCHIGHILTHGDGSNVCMSDGTWKFPVPNCRGHSTTSFCAGRCGRRSDYRRYPCQCNITCRWFKNCCSDFAETCPGSGN